MTDPPDLPDGASDQPAEGGQFDLSGLLEAAQSMQQQLVEAQAKAAETTVEGVAGGGAVRIEATAGLEFTNVHIQPDAVDPDDVEMLEDLILAALRDAVARANDVQAQALGGLGSIGPALGDIGLQPPE